MKAGRELDALVAEKVMGWQRESQSWYDEEGVEGTAWYDPDDKLGNPSATAFGWGNEIDYESGSIWEIPTYSTSIAAAWEVVEKLAAEHVGINVAYGWARGWYCDLMSASKRDFAEAETAPLAICLAALKAVGAAPEEGEKP